MKYLFSVSFWNISTHKPKHFLYLNYCKLHTKNCCRQRVVKLQNGTTLSKFSPTINIATNNKSGKRRGTQLCEKILQSCAPASS